jgi:hypothetical protein
VDLHKFQENTRILDVTIYLSAVSAGDNVFIYVAFRSSDLKVSYVSIHLYTTVFRSDIAIDMSTVFGVQGHG